MRVPTQVPQAGAQERSAVVQKPPGQGQEDEGQLRGRSRWYE